MLEIIKQYFKNRRYVTMTSNKIAVGLFTFWGFITLLTPTDGILKSIGSLHWRIVVAILILTAIYLLIIVIVAAYSNYQKSVKVFDLHSNHSLYVEYGDLFNSDSSTERKNIAFAGNRCFDTIVDDDLVGSGKIHGTALKRIYEKDDRDQAAVDKEIQGNLSLHGYWCEGLGREKKRKGNVNRYEVGSVAEIKGVDNEKYFILGLTYFDQELRAHVEKEDYIKAIGSLVKYISDRSQGFPTYLPVIGTGGADVGDVNELISFIIKTFELYKDRINCDIHIVVSNEEKKLGIMNLKKI